MLLCVMMYAQELPKIIPPSPEASSLGKFGEVPVSYYTGVPNIGIPIYTIQQKGISIPVGLNYHSRGVQVSEIASRVGIGWALSYGGIISRQTRGSADDAGGYYSYLNNSYYSAFFANPNSVAGAQVMFDLVIAGLGRVLDLEPDMFFYSAGNQSGKFFYKQGDKITPIQKKFSDVDIETIWTGNTITGFILKDTQGNTFYYGMTKDKNVTKSKYGRDNTTQSVVNANYVPAFTNNNAAIDSYDSWYLLEIETATNEKIEFFYEPEVTNYVRKSFDSYKYNKATQTKELSSSYSKIQSNQFQLSKIVFNQGELHFNKSTIAREDLTGGYALDNIELYDNNSKLIKKYDLGYTYSVNTIQTNYLTHQVQMDPTSHKRLMLASVTQKDALNNSLPPHSFTYSTVTLPNRFSNSQDSWGYFNGKSNGDFLTFFDYGINTNNREVDTLKSEAGMLKKITYPTGGYTNFSYEHNTVTIPAEMNDIITKYINPTKKEYATLSHLESNLYYNGNYYEKQVVINNKVGFLNTNISFDDSTNCSNSIYVPGCKFQVFITGGPNNVSYQLYQGNNQIVNSALVDGTYSLKVYPKYLNHNPLNPNSLDGFVIGLDWDTQPVVDRIYAAGKRIKKITQHDTNGAIVNQKEYEYETSGNTSGNLFGLPAFHSLTEEQSTVGTILEQYGSTPGSPLSAAQGNSVGYSHVTEYVGTKTNNKGKTDFEFTVNKDYGAFYEYPYFFPSSNEWIRGKNLKTKVYKNNGDNSYTIQKEVINEYLYGGDLNPDYFDDNGGIAPVQSSYSYNQTRTKFVMPLIKFVPNTNGLDYKIHYKFGGTFDLHKTTSKDYYENGNTVINTTDYSYNYDKHYQTKQTKLVKSNGKTILSSYVYPQDKTSLTTAETLLKTDKIVTPIQTFTYQDDNNNGVGVASELLSSQYTVYNKDNWPNLNLPQKVQTSKGTSALEDRIVFHSYDAEGNPIEVSKKDGTHIVYIWGYDKTQPVAKIENATFTDIPTSVYNSIVAASNADTNSTTENTLRTELAKLRNTTTCPNLSEAIISTFTHDPLIGVTSVTDSRGRTIYYEYDTFNRLLQVKDHDGKILSKNEYNYKN